MATNPSAGTCLKCGTALVPGAGFCGSCGTPAGSTGQPPMPPPMPLGMPPRPMMQGVQSVTLPLDAASATQVAMTAISSNKGEVVSQGPNSLGFRLKMPWAGGRLTGTIEIMPTGPAQTTLAVMLRPEYGSLIPIAVGALLILLLPAMLNPYSMMFFSPMLMFLLLGGSLAANAYNLGGPGLEKKRTALVNALYAQGGTPAGVAQPQAPAFNPAAAAPGAPAAGVPQATPFEQLRKLGELRDSGAISAADFEQAKAAILAKLS